MTGDCILITAPAVDFNKFLSAGHKMTGKSLSSAADKKHGVTDAEKFLSCLSVMGGDTGEMSPRLMAHLSFSLLVWGDERDLLDVFQICGLPFVVTDTVTRGVQGAVITGSLSRWRDAIASGMRPMVEPGVRHLFGQMLSRFEQSGLSSVWNDYTRTNAPSGGLYLTLKR